MTAPATCPCIQCAAILAAQCTEDCRDCDGRGYDDCPSCRGTGDSDHEGRTLCGYCYGKGTGQECERCGGSGEIEYAPCAQCLHLTERRHLHADAHLAAVRGLPMAWVCEGCTPCASCEAWVHCDVMSDAGRCLGCEERLRQPSALARFLADDRALESVEWAIIAGLVVTGLVALILALGAFVKGRLGELLRGAKGATP